MPEIKCPVFKLIAMIILIIFFFFSFDKCLNILCRNHIRIKINVRFQSQLNSTSVFKQYSFDRTWYKRSLKPSATIYHFFLRSSVFKTYLIKIVMFDCINLPSRFTFQLFQLIQLDNLNAAISWQPACKIPELTYELSWNDCCRLPGNRLLFTWKFWLSAIQNSINVRSPLWAAKSIITPVTIDYSLVYSTKTFPLGFAVPLFICQTPQPIH